MKNDSSGKKLFLIVSFLTKKRFKKSIWKMIVMLNRATKDTFSCLKIFFRS